MTPAGDAPEAVASILLVDDDTELCELLEQFLGRRGYRVELADD